MKQINSRTIKQFNNSTMYSQGSALIITILLVTVLASIAFSTSRLTISEIVQTGQLEDSELAYQAAEGCVETGLLLYRYNRDAEVPADVDGGMSSDVDQSIRYNITDGEEVGDVDSSSGPPANKSQSYCDLRMWHHNDAGEAEVVESSKCDQKKFDAGLCVAVPYDKLDEVCGTTFEKCYQDTDSTYYIVPALPQDQVVEYDVEGMSDIVLRWVFLEQPQNDAEEIQFNFLLIPINNQGETIDDFGSRGLYNYNFNNQNVRVSFNQSFNIKKIRLKPLGGDLLSLLSINDISNIKLDSKNTYIESTGYYGSAKRKLKVALDRTTQTLLSPYDFILYSSE